MSFSNRSNFVNASFLCHLSPANELIFTQRPHCIETLKRICCFSNRPVVIFYHIVTIMKQSMFKQATHYTMHFRVVCCINAINNELNYFYSKRFKIFSFLRYLNSDLIMRFSFARLFYVHILGNELIFNK